MGRSSILGLVCALGCGSDVPSGGETSTGATTEPSSTTAVCVDGAVQPCICPPGVEGEQMCFNGTFGSCECVASSTTSTTATSSESSGESGGSSTTGPTAICGNGELEAGEQCDDGNADDEDECTNACVALCGPLWDVDMAGVFAVTGIGLDGDGNIVVVGAVMNGLGASAHASTFDPDGTLLSEVDATEVLLGGNPTTAIDSDGNAYTFGPLQFDGEAGQTVRLVKAAPDASTVWMVDIDPLVVPSTLNGVAIAANGDVLVSAGIDVVDGDDDVWLAQYAAVDGTQVWSTTHTGPNVGGFSIDEGGPIAVAGDNTILVASKLRQSFNQQDVTMLRFPSDGGPATFEAAVFPDPGDNHAQNQDDMEANGDRAVIAIPILGGPGQAPNGYIATAFDGDVEAWSVHSDVLTPDGDPLLPTFPRVAIADDGSVFIGSRAVVEGDGDPTERAIASHFDADGELTCSRIYDEEGVASAAAAEVVALPDGTFVVAIQGTPFRLARFRV